MLKHKLTPMIEIMILVSYSVMIYGLVDYPRVAISFIVTVVIGFYHNYGKCLNN